MTLRALALAAAALAGCGSSTRGSDGGAPSLPGTPEGPSPNQVGATVWTSATNAVTTFTFWLEALAAQPAPPCTREPLGACTIRRCAGSSNDAGTGFLSVGGFGAAMLTGPDGAIPLVGDTADGNATTIDGAAPWLGGERYTLATTGDRVPAFTADVQAPTPARILSPAKLPVISPVATSRADLLTVTWTPVALGTMELTIDGPPAEAGVASIEATCDVPALVGSVTLPPELLYKFASRPLQPVALGAFFYNEAFSTVDGWLIDFAAVDVAADDASGNGWAMQLALE